MTYVYLLYDYEEHGPQHMMATMERVKIRDMAIAKWASEDPAEEHAKYPHLTLEYFESQKREMIDGVDAALAKTDEELLEGIQFRGGWGWPSLQTVVLA